MSNTFNNNLYNSYWHELSDIKHIIEKDYANKFPLIFFSTAVDILILLIIFTIFPLVVLNTIILKLFKITLNEKQSDNIFSFLSLISIISLSIFHALYFTNDFYYLKKHFEITLYFCLISSVSAFLGSILKHKYMSYLIHSISINRNNEFTPILSKQIISSNYLNSTHIWFINTFKDIISNNQNYIFIPIDNKQYSITFHIHKDDELFGPYFNYDNLFLFFKFNTSDLTSFEINSFKTELINITNDLSFQTTNNFKNSLKILFDNMERAKNLNILINTENNLKKQTISKHKKSKI